jgi:hypothetical protein
VGTVLNLILTHQSADCVSKLIAYWEKYVLADSILIAYGGPEKEFNRISSRQKIFASDPRLRTRDHQRELQSYTQLFRAVNDFLQREGADFKFVHFAEYDHLPIVADLNARQIDRIESQCADVLGFHLHRVDGTSNAHFLYNASNEKFGRYWSDITHRGEPEVVLSMFGSGSFWTREAFCAVASFEEPFPIYVEIFLPTLAHHLGFRVRDYGEQDKFVGILKDKTSEIAEAQKKGAWTLHPVKYLWER